MFKLKALVYSQRFLVGKLKNPSDELMGRDQFNVSHLKEVLRCNSTVED